MANKSIIFTAPKIAEIVDFDIPQIADDEVLVKLECSTISAGTERDDAKSLLKLLSGGRINLATLVEEVHSPDEAPEVFARLANDASFPITQFDWSKME